MPTIVGTSISMRSREGSRRGSGAPLGRRSAIERFLRIYADERRRLAGNKVGLIEKLDRRLAAIDAELDRATSLLIKGILDEEQGAAQIQELKQERTSLLAERTATEDVEPDLTIEAALKGPAGSLEADEFDAVRNLTEKITVTPGDTTLENAIELGARPLPVPGGIAIVGGDNGSGGPLPPIPPTADPA